MTMYQNAVGERIYAWTRAAGQPSPGTKDCVISAHGGQSIINSTFAPNGDTLVFYCAHGCSLVKDLDVFLEGTVDPVEEISNGQCQDYILAKYQGRHNPSNAETYAEIADYDEHIEASIEKTKSELLQAALTVTHPNRTKYISPPGFFGRQDETKFLYAGEQLDRMKRRMDIITVRNRRLKRRELTLSKIIEELHKAGYAYAKFHCLFCRGPN